MQQKLLKQFAHTHMDMYIMLVTTAPRYNFEGTRRLATWNLAMIWVTYLNLFS